MADRNTWFGELRALGAMEPAEPGWSALRALANQAAAIARGPEELAEVYLPALIAQAARWPDPLREPAEDWASEHPALLALARTLPLTTSAELDALPGLLRWATDARIIRVSPQMMHALPMLGVLPQPHALDTLIVWLSGEHRRLVLDVGRDMPAWTRRLICHGGYGYQIAPPLDGLPLTHLTLRGFALTDADELGAVESLPALTSLTLIGCRMGAEGAQALAASRAMRRLEELDIEATPLHDAGIWALVHADALAGLTRLRLSGASMWRDGVQAIALAELPRLRTLQLDGAELASREAIALAQSSWIDKLERLDVRHNRIGPEGLDALRAAMSPGSQLLIADNWGAGVEDGPDGGSITLRDVPITPPILRELLRVAAKRGTSRLHIERARLDSITLAVLLDTPLPALRELLLSNNILNVADIEALCDSALIGQLTALDLSANFGLVRYRADLAARRRALDRLMTCATALTSLTLQHLGLDCVPATLPASLRALDLYNNDLDDAEVQHLATQAAALHHIDLANNPNIGPGALRAVMIAAPQATLRAEGSWGHAARAPDAAHITLTHPNAAQLDELCAISPTLTHTERVTLSDAPMGVDHAAQLRPPGLTGVTLLRCGLTGVHIDAMAPLIAQLRGMTLSFNPTLGDAGAAALARCDLSRLRALALAEVDLTLAGLTALLPALTAIDRLDLSGNPRLDSAAAAALMAWPGLGQLSELRMNSCALGPDAFVMLGFSPTKLYADGCWGKLALDAANSRDGVLDLSGVEHMGSAQIAELAAWPPLSELTELFLTELPLTDADAIALAASPYIRDLHIGVSGCPLTLPGLRALRLACRAVTS
jgi:hypothetical protein